MHENPPPALCDRCQKPVEGQFRIIDQSIDPRSLHSDYILSNEETCWMKSILEDKERRIERYEEEIVQVRQRLLVLEEEKRFLEDDLLKCRSALGIWRKLPSEILEMIFEITCCSSSDSGHSLVIDYSHSIKTRIMSPVPLSHVCSRWRSIALGSPKLWSTIFIHFDNIPEFAYRLLQTFIERSGSWPLSLQLQSQDCDIPEHGFDLWKVLLENSSQWRTLRLHFPSTELLERDPLPCFSNLSFSNLISLGSFIEAEKVDPNGRFWKSLCRAPNLTEVSTTDIYPLHSLPYAQLTTLKIHYAFLDVSSEMLLEVLQIPKNLLHLTINVNSASDSSRKIDAYPVVQMPSLRSLKIFGSCSLKSSGLLQAVFRSLQMPVLESLDLYCSAAGIERWPKPFLAMLDRSPSLKRLSLYLLKFDSHPEEPLSTILEATPNLTHLEILSSPGLNNFREEIPSVTKYLRSLVSDLKYKSLLSKLRHLSLYFDHATQYESILSDLLELAKVRGPRSTILPLSTIQFQCYKGESKLLPVMDSNLLEEMENLKADGLSVTFKEKQCWEFVTFRRLERVQAIG